ncbi:MAG: ATP-binding protein [Myxococcota bacterium]
MLSVCVVHDDADLRDRLIRSLEQAGLDATCTEVTGGPPRVGSPRADLVFVALRTEADARAALEALVARAVPVVVISSGAADERLAALRAGAREALHTDEIDTLGARLPPVLDALEREAALRREHELLRDAVRATGAGVWDYGIGTGVLTLDARCLELFGLEGDEPERPLSALIAQVDPRDRTAVERGLLAVTEIDPASIGPEHRRYHQEYRLEGSGRWIQASGAVMVSGPGERPGHVRLVGTATDVTQRKKYEHAIADEVHTVATLQKVGRTLVEELDPSRITELVMRESLLATRMSLAAFFPAPGTGIPVRALARDALDDVSVLDDVSTPEALRERAGAAAIERSVRIVSQTGRELGHLHFVLVGEGVSERDERTLDGIGRWASIALENARLVEAERAARSRAERAATVRNEVLAIVSHDLNQPINAMAIGTRLLEHAATHQVPPQPAQIDILKRSLDQMRTLIRDLLDAMRTESGALEVSPRPADPAAICEKARLAAEPQITQGGGTLGLTAGDLPDVLADEARILQVLGNLLSNAARHAGGTEVRIALRHVPPSVWVDVTDGGPGIPDAEIPHIFDRFWQGKRRTTGTVGLGLAIARGIVEAHGGALVVSSKVGEGSTFSFSLPVVVGSTASS